MDGAFRMLAMAGPITVNSTDACHAACRAGLGIIQAPTIGVRKDIESGVLVEVLPQLRPDPMPVALLYAHRRNLPKRAEVLEPLFAE